MSKKNKYNKGMAVVNDKTVELPSGSSGDDGLPPLPHYQFYPKQPQTQFKERKNLNQNNDIIIEEEGEDKYVEILVDPTQRGNLGATTVPRPWFLYVMSAAQIICLVWSLILNSQMTGSVIQTNPFNYLIGASAGTLIRMGGRSVACMKPIPNITDVIWLCPEGIPPDTSYLKEGYCTPSQICGLGGFGSSNLPNQWYRFIIPIFLHGGILHLLLNLIFQIRTGFQMEKDIGWWRMALIYFTCGIGSFIFSGIFNGGSFSPTTGSSGALYGLVACVVIDMVKNWKILKNPWLEFLIIMAQVVFLLVVGTLPYIDNFAHVGGFLTGILAGFLFLPSLSFSKWDGRFKSILTFIALPLMIGWFVLLIKGFYDWDLSESCEWCKYINCIPGMPWCNEKWGTTTQSSRQ